MPKIIVQATNNSADAAKSEEETKDYTIDVEGMDVTFKDIMDKLNITRERKDRLREMLSEQQKTDSTNVATIPTTEDPSNVVLAVKESVSGIVENTLATQREEARRTDLDIAAIAPERANWDLKRDLQKQLDVLKPLNDAVIANLVRKRIQASADADGLADAIEAHVRSSQL